MILIKKNLKMARYRLKTTQKAYRLQSLFLWSTRSIASVHNLTKWKKNFQLSLVSWHSLSASSNSEIDSVYFILTGFVFVEDTGALKRKCTVDTPPSCKKRASGPSLLDDDSESDTCKKDCADSMIGNFAHLHLGSIFIEPRSTTKGFSVAILLPSGVGPGGYSTRVREGGRELELTVRCPRPISSVHRLHRVWLRADSDAMESYLPKMMGFENFLKGLREKKANIVESVAHIVL